MWAATSGGSENTENSVETIPEHDPGKERKAGIRVKGISLISCL